MKMGKNKTIFREQNAGNSFILSMAVSEITTMIVDTSRGLFSTCGN